MNILRSLVAGAALLALPVEAQEHRFEADPISCSRNCSASWTSALRLATCNIGHILFVLRSRDQTALAFDASAVCGGHRLG